MSDKEPQHTVDTKAKPGEPGTVEAGKRLKDHEADSSHGRLTEQAKARRPDGKEGEAAVEPTDTPRTSDPEQEEQP